MDTIRVERTKRGFPAIWESGGYDSKQRTGSSITLAGSDGSPLKYIFQNGIYKARNKDHALFIVKTGDIVVQTSIVDEMETISISRISDITISDAHLSPIARSEGGIWDSPISPKYIAVINASREIANTSNCWRTLYGKDGKDFN